MKGTQKDNLSWYRRWRRVIASLTLFAFLLQGTSVAWAQALTNVQVTNDLDLNATFQRVLQQVGYQYEGVPYIATDSPMNQIKGMESFRERLLQNNPESLGEPTNVPISVGDITTIIPVYPSYKPVGTPFVTNRYIRQQVRELLGRHLVDSDVPEFQSESQQLFTLYANAYQFAVDNPTVKYGDPLSALGYSRVSSPKNMAWPERRVINDEEVLVPVVYLTGATVADRKLTGHTVELNGPAEFGSINIQNVEVKLGRQGFLSAVDDLTCSNCTIANDDSDVTLLAGGTFDLLSGLITAEGNISIGAKNVKAETLIYRYDTATGHGSRYGEIAGFNAETGDINIRSYADIALSGVELSAGGAIKLGADGNIYLGTQKLTSSSTERYGRNYEARSSVEYLISRLSAEETIQLIANGNIKIDGAEIVSNQGHIELLAGLGIYIEDELAQYKYNKKAKYGRKSTKVSAYQTVAIRSLLDAGKAIRLHSALGDITLRATDIRSNDGTSVTADAGGVNLLMTVETDHYSYSSVKKGLFTTKVKNKGHYVETGIPNAIIGGLTVEALNGVQIQYKGDSDLSLDQQIAKLSQFEGLEWMGEVRAATPDADWQAIELEYEKWNESKTSLSPAFAAVVSIAVAIATSGAGSSAASFIMGSAATSAGLGTATAAAIAAGTQALLGQVVLAVANGAVDGDIGQAMEDMASSETFQALAIAMVTAGALDMLDTSFFSHVDPSKVDPSVLHDAQGHLNLLGQSTQAVSYAATRAGVTALVEGEDFGDFSDIFTKNLLQFGVMSIGATMANEIKGLDTTEADGFQTAVRYIAHAGAGCIIGSAQARINSGDTRSACGAGALGAATGEIVSDIYKSSVDVSADVELLEGFLQKHGLEDPSQLSREQLAEFQELEIASLALELEQLQRDGIDLAKFSGALAAFVAGADADSVNIAGMTAENAAENNALFLIPLAIILLKAVDVAFFASDVKEIYDAFERSSDEGRAALAQWAGEEAAARILAQFVPGTTTLSKFIEILGDLRIKGINPDSAKELSKKIDAPTVLDSNGRFIDEVLNQDYAKYVERKTRQGKAPRDPEEWLEVRNYFKYDSPLARGNLFNEQAIESRWYRFNEVTLANGKRVDSYDDVAGEIVSRKATNLDNISMATFEKYLAEMKQKYAPGQLINAPKYGDELKGKTLQGRHILEIPDVNQDIPNIEDYISLARDKYDITIRFRPELL